MTKRRDWIVDLLTEITEDKVKSEAIIEILLAEGVLRLGYGDHDVDAILDCFKAVYGTTKASSQDRWAAHRLADKYGGQAIVGIIKLLGHNSKEPYCPVVNNISELEKKFVSVMSFLRKLDKEEDVIEV